jgi:hypothetical protein
MKVFFLSVPKTFYEYSFINYLFIAVRKQLMQDTYEVLEGEIPTSTAETMTRTPCHMAGR